MQTRRDFNSGLASLAFGGLALSGCGKLAEAPSQAQRVPGFRTALMRQDSYYGKLEADRMGLLDLPPGFTYDVISRYEDRMDDDYLVPDKADGMGSFSLPGNRVVLVRNHELKAIDFGRGPFRERRPENLKSLAQDGDSLPPPGGTTTILFNCDTGKVERQYLSLTGTIRNCAGGATPWGSWLTCEEDFTAGHGYVHEVPALHEGIAKPQPLKHFGRFQHEAAAVDPETGITYMTEDQIDSLFYRYVPRDRRRPLDEGGELQALTVSDGSTDSRNWSATTWTAGRSREAVWKAIDPGDGGRDDLRKQGHRAVNAVRFANGEGIYLDHRELYFTCTSGGAIKSGQIMRYTPDRNDINGGTIELFLESTDPRAFNFADNLVVAPNGHLIVCEDPYFGGERNYLLRPVAEKLKVPPAPSYLRGVTPDGQIYNLARLRSGSELAGACFSPKGEILFVNVYSPTQTLAIHGPWKGARSPDWELYEAQGKMGPGPFRY